MSPVEPRGEAVITLWIMNLLRRLTVCIGMALVLTVAIAAAPAGASQRHSSKPPVGIGSTFKAWAKAYGKSHGVCVDCYGYSTHNSDSGKTWLYSGVSGISGSALTSHVVLGYNMNLLPHTTWDEAQGYVLRMLPKDAVVSRAVGVIIEHDEGTTCGVFTATSATLAKEKAMTTPLPPHNPNGVAPSGMVQVTLEDLDTNGNARYNPNNVQTVMVSVVSALIPDIC